MLSDMPSFAEIMRSMAWLLFLAASFLMPFLSLAFALLSAIVLVGYLTANATMAFGRRIFIPVRA